MAGTGLICDEPLSNLNADLRERMRVEISSLVRESGATAVYLTHDQADADGTVEIGLDGSALLRPCRARTSASGAAGGDGVLLVRPTGLHLGRPNDGDHHLVGTVADVAVGLRLDPAGCHVFPAAAAQQAAPATAEPASQVPLCDVGPEFVPPAQRL